jgi:hypothetical protein
LPGPSRADSALASPVRPEIAECLPSLDADQLIEDYRRLMKLTNAEMVPYPDKDLVRASRRLIRHQADVPVLLSAMASTPDCRRPSRTWVASKTSAVRSTTVLHYPARPPLR